jgi:precorrin-6A/cobalt-precorrin-6A reductase
LIARVLDCEETRQRLATHRDSSQLRWGRGPFSIEDNLELLSVPGRVVLVTKDSGERGGLYAKFEAARRVGARVIVVSRPVEAPGATSSVSELIASVKRSCS